MITHKDTLKYCGDAVEGQPALSLRLERVRVWLFYSGFWKKMKGEERLAEKLCVSDKDDDGRINFTAGSNCRGCRQLHLRSNQPKLPQSRRRWEREEGCTMPLVGSGVVICLHCIQLQFAPLELSSSAVMQLGGGEVADDKIRG